MKNKPVVSVIIVNFNTKEITLNCLSSLYQFVSDVNFEVIVIDNGSHDGSGQALAKFASGHKNLHLIRSATNLGFGRANNLGAKQARGEYLLFLNSDTLFRENCILVSLHRIEDDKRIAALSCNLQNSDLSHQPSGGFFPNLFRLFAWQFFLDDLPFIGNKIRSIHPHLSVSNPDWITGAFMLIPAAAFWNVGGFDENIFMYTEEMELCYRLKKNGGKVVINNETSIVHLGGASGGTYLALTKEVEGMLYFWHKHLPAWQLPLAKLCFLFGSLLRLVIFGIIGGNEVARHAYREALRLVA